MLPEIAADVWSATVSLQGTPFTSPGAEVAFPIGHLLFGLVLAFTDEHFLDAESTTRYAEAKGVPAVESAVPFSGGLLLFGVDEGEPSSEFVGASE